MPESIIFRGAQIVNFDMRQSPKGESTYIRIHMRADFSQPVMEAMGWEPRPEGWGGADLIGELTGVAAMMKPSSPQLKQYGFKMPIKQVKDFKLVVLKQKEENDDDLVLTFVIETNSKRAYVTLGNWIENLGKDKGQLTVSYTEQTVIGNADGPNEDQRQAALAEND